MANNNIQQTHENIHTGLSGLNNDEKWKNMLNFRSAESRTSVVPHKYLWFSAGCAGLHTLIAGLSGHALAIGKHQSFGFVGGDRVNAYPLWRLRQRYLGTLGARDEQSQRLLVQGSYTGSTPLKIRVHFIDGKLIPFWAVPEIPTPEVPAGDIDYGCNFTPEYEIAARVIDYNTHSELSGATAIWSLSGVPKKTRITDENGSYVVSLPADSYSVVTSKENYVTETDTKVISADGTYNTKLIPVWFATSIAYKLADLVTTTGGYTPTSPPYNATLYRAKSDHLTSEYPNGLGDADFPNYFESVSYLSNSNTGSSTAITAGHTYSNGIDLFTAKSSYTYVDTGVNTTYPGGGRDWPSKFRRLSHIDNVTVIRLAERYEVGAIVFLEDFYYRCDVSHEPTPTNRPGTGSLWASFWTLLP